MESIGKLLDDFIVAYQHSLYAIDKERKKLSSNRDNSRLALKKKFDKSRSLTATVATNQIMASIHQIKDTFDELTKEDDTVIRAAEYLAAGTVKPKRIEQIVFSNSSIPWVMPFLGHKNVCIESSGDASQSLGLQFALNALKQTAPGQLDVTVVNPELRPEFSAFSRLPGFKMLSKNNEIVEAFASLAEEIVKTDELLQGRMSSLLALRKEAMQPVGRLRLIVIQDLPNEISADLKSTLLRVTKGAPRAGIAVMLLVSKVSTRNASIVNELKQLNCFMTYTQTGNTWRINEEEFNELEFSFPAINNNETTKDVADLIEAAKKTTAVTIPFDQIEDTSRIWTETSIEHIEFNLGKSGLDTVSVCIGDNVTQHHNILISGAAGKGKSNLLEVMIHSLCTRYSPEELELYLLDFKDGLTFKPYSSFGDSSWLPHARMLGLESDRDVGLAVLKDLEAERRRRANLFSNAGNGVHDYESYRRANPSAILPRIVLIVDEYQKLFDISDEISEEASALLENLVRQGRACSIHIVLASQSITGTIGLLGKDERIYAQFPVRIALQNTISESYSIFGIGNDAAAQLRVRGEAVINTNYGAIDSNRKMTVAFADPDKMHKLREKFCSCWTGTSYPVIFRKKDVVDYSMFNREIRKWRSSVENGGAMRLPCGIKLSVNRDVLSISFTNEVGRNIALLGAAEDLQDEAEPGRKNNAVGMIQCFALALALQHPEGNARFIVINGLPTDVYKNSNMPRWARLMERFGYPIEEVNASEASSWFKDYKLDVAEQDYEEDTYILGVGMDRCSNLADCDLCGESGAAAFQELLRYGSKGVHFICWWSNVSMYKSHIGFGNEGYIGTKVLLRTDTDTARDILGPFANWSVRDNRAYIHDSSDLPADVVVMPSQPLSDRVCGKVEAEVW